MPQVPVSRTAHYGGSVILADYCPYIQEFTWKSNNVIVRGSHCAFSENNPGQCRPPAAARRAVFTLPETGRTRRSGWSETRTRHLSGVFTFQLKMLR